MKQLRGLYAQTFFTFRTVHVHGRKSAKHFVVNKISDYVKRY